MTQRLRALGVAGEFVEFFGPGVATLDAGERAVVANMAPEYGATTGFFAVDARTLDYLRTTGRPESLLRLVEAYARRVGSGSIPTRRRATRARRRSTSRTIGMHVAGPQRPQDLLPLSGDCGERSPSWRSRPSRPSRRARRDAPPSGRDRGDHELHQHLGSTPARRRRPGRAERARERGMRVPAWVKTSLAPGSPAAADYLRRAGLLDDLAAVGFDIVGFGCTTCIGNPGPLPEPIRAAQRAGSVRAVAAISGNRNFPGRVHPDLDLGFLMSPPLVVAFALAGDAERDLTRAPVGVDADGEPVSLQDLLPGPDEIAAHVRKGADPDDYVRAFAAASLNPAWRALAAPSAARFPWQAGSTILRRPPYASLAAGNGSQLGRYVAHPLLVVGDDVTTDHISPASAIPPDSLVADFLVARGDDRGDLNVFASRRGNWEVMLRAAFHNKSLVNLLRPGLPVAHTLHAPSGDVLPLWEAAERYRAAGDAVVLVAGERYGTGSSRDWAAKGQRLLGIRAVLAVSFERIHRSNLIGMGILPLRLPAGVASGDAGDRIPATGSRSTPTPTTWRRAGRCRCMCCAPTGPARSWTATAAVETALEIELLRAGGVLPAILRRELRQEEAA